VKELKIIFMGTPEFALPCIKRMSEKGYDITAVVTKPDKPKGRGKKLSVTPIKQYACEKGIKILQPENVRTEEFRKQLAELNADMFVTCAYGKILTEDILNMPQYGCINVHASLLPKLRGPAPLQRAIINGENKTGITIMYTDKGIDTGDILSQKEVEITPDMTYGQLHDIMSIAGAKLLTETIEKIEAGTVTRTKQNTAEATCAQVIKKEITHIDWNNDAEIISNLVRGLDPFPGAYSLYMEKRMKIFKTDLYGEEFKKKIPGTVIKANAEGIVVATKTGAIRITELQFDSGKRMSVKEYLRGHDIKENTVLK